MRLKVKITYNPELEVPNVHGIDCDKAAKAEGPCGPTYKSDSYI